MTGCASGASEWRRAAKQEMPPSLDNSVIVRSLSGARHQSDRPLAPSGPRGDGGGFGASGGGAGRRPCGGRRRAWRAGTAV